MNSRQILVPALIFGLIAFNELAISLQITPCTFPPTLIAIWAILTYLDKTGRPE